MLPGHRKRRLGTVEAASQYYFKKHASALSSEEAAEPAAALPYPKRRHPGSQSRNYQNRVELLERKMASRYGFSSGRP